MWARQAEGAIQSPALKAAGEDTIALAIGRRRVEDERRILADPHRAQPGWRECRLFVVK